VRPSRSIVCTVSLGIPRPRPWPGRVPPSPASHCDRVAPVPSAHNCVRLQVMVTAWGSGQSESEDPITSARGESREGKYQKSLIDAKPVSCFPYFCPLVFHRTDPLLALDFLQFPVRPCHSCYVRAEYELTQISSGPMDSYCDHHIRKPTLGPKKV